MFCAQMAKGDESQRAKAMKRAERGGGEGVEGAEAGDMEAATAASEEEVRQEMHHMFAGRSDLPCNIFAITMLCIEEPHDLQVCLAAAVAPTCMSVLVNSIRGGNQSGCLAAAVFGYINAC